MITFDSNMLKAFIDENCKFIIGARINKIQQPTRRELIIQMRNNAETRQLYINITPQMYHLCFASDDSLKKRLIKIPNPPPMFCMLLRKYLNNSKIARVIQPDQERILELYFETYNALGDSIYLCLAVELMGKYSNVILYNTDTNVILGCAHNVGSDKSQVREVYGQIPYEYPPKQANNDFLNQRYGFLNSFGKDIYDKNFNNIIDNYYAELIHKSKFKTLKFDYISQVNQKLKKCENSLNKMALRKNNNIDFDKYRLYGDLLMANMYNLKDYVGIADVYDYENNKNISIDLLKNKTIKENANDYYKKYNKSKITEMKLEELIENQKQNKEYLESVLYSLEIAKGIEDLTDIEKEINSNSNDITNKSKNESKIAINEITINPNTRIYIGKNNKQNDYIISKLASDNDLWFHTKDCPGSHVLLKSQEVTHELILECARIAKKNSSGANSSKIGIVYTKRKYLRKPPKANLGYVTYKNEKEIVID